MAQEYTFAVAFPVGGTEFPLSEPYTLSGIPDDSLDHRIPSSPTDGADGEYQAPSTLEPRTVTLRGTLQGASPSDLMDRRDALFAAFPARIEGELIRRLIDLGTMAVVAERRLRCRVASRSPGEQDGMPSNDWTIRLRAADPCYYAPTLLPSSPTALNVAASTPTSVTAGGTESALPVYTLVVSVAGTIRLRIGGVVVWEFAAAATGTYILDNEAQTFTKSGVSKLSEVLSGGFFTLPPTAASLDFTYASSGALSSGTLQYRRRYSMGV
jgi:hypothetical protein